MKITEAQYSRIEQYLPRPRGKFSVSNLNVLNAILYVLENGSKWRCLPEHFGNWHTIYTRMNRWSKNGVLDQVFIALQQEQIIKFKVEFVSLDSTAAKVHPDGMGALKKRPPIHRQIKRRMDNQDSYGCLVCYNSHSLYTFSRSESRCPRRPIFAGRNAKAI